jgi:hypothetical protein
VNLRSFVGELKRRDVYKVAIAYAVVAWLLGLEENLALIQTIFGENSHAITTLIPLLQTPYHSWLYGLAPITPAFLRLDPIWDPLRSDPAFQKLCEEK